MKKLNYINMKRKDAVELYSLLRELRNGGMSKESLTAYILMRIKLKSIFDEFEKARQEISEQTKPDDWKDGDASAKWNEAFQPVIEKWLSEEVDIKTNVLSASDLVDIISKNDLTGGIQDFLFETLVSN